MDLSVPVCLFSFSPFVKTIYLERLKAINLLRIVNK